MSKNKSAGKKTRLAAKMKVRSAPRWADIKKFGLKRARTRRIRVEKAYRNWRRGAPLRV
jgi:ribosomal protein L39E